MAEIVTVEGQQYLKRNPLGVLGLSLVTLGVYFFIWYYKVNDELRRAQHDLTISPMRSLMAMLFGWLLIVPPFIAMYNTARHVQFFETRLEVRQTVEPVIALLLMFVFSVGNGAYLQDHLNRGWDAATGRTRLPVTPPVVPSVTG